MPVDRSLEQEYLAQKFKTVSADALRLCDQRAQAGRGSFSETRGGINRKERNEYDRLITTSPPTLNNAIAQVLGKPSIQFQGGDTEKSSEACPLYAEYAITDDVHKRTMLKRKVSLYMR